MFDSLMLGPKTRAGADAKAKRVALADVSVYGEFRTSGEDGLHGFRRSKRAGKRALSASSVMVRL